MIGNTPSSANTGMKRRRYTCNAPHCTRAHDHAHTGLRQRTHTESHDSATHRSRSTAADNDGRRRGRERATRAATPPRTPIRHATRHGHVAHIRPRDPRLRPRRPASRRTHPPIFGDGKRRATRRGRHTGRMPWNGLRKTTRTLVADYDVRGAHDDPPVSLPLAAINKSWSSVESRATIQRSRSRKTPRADRAANATHAIYERLRHAAQQGTAVIAYSFDLDEIVELGNRVLRKIRRRTSPRRPTQLGKRSDA